MIPSLTVTRPIRTDISRSFTKSGFSSLFGGPVLPMRCASVLTESNRLPNLCRLAKIDVRTLASSSFNSVRLRRPSHPFSCNHTAWIEIAIFVFLTLTAQVFLTVRSVHLSLDLWPWGADECGFQDIRSNFEEQDGSGILLWGDRTPICTWHIFYPSWCQ